MPTIRIECESCRGTGLYVGMAERDGAAVVCSRCKARGWYELEYREFAGLCARDDVKRVFRANPGIRISGSDLTRFGGVSYEEWRKGDEDWRSRSAFTRGSEMRGLVCPAWWVQSAEGRSLGWKECRSFGSTFRSCQHFGEKAECWKAYDGGKR